MDEKKEDQCKPKKAWGGAVRVSDAVKTWLKKESQKQRRTANELITRLIKFRLKYRDLK